MHQVQFQERRLIGVKKLIFTNLWFVGIQIMLLFFCSTTSSNKSLYDLHNLQCTALQ